MILCAFTRSTTWPTVSLSTTRAFTIKTTLLKNCCDIWLWLTRLATGCMWPQKPKNNLSSRLCVILPVSLTLYHEPLFRLIGPAAILLRGNRRGPGENRYHEENGREER